MCKILVLTNLKQVQDLPKLITETMRLLGRTEQDGVGYAVQTNQGVFGERSLDTDCFQYSLDKIQLDLSWATHSQNRFGIEHKNAAALSGIFHGRVSTNHCSLVNTHPLQKHGWTLIHNGVVTNCGKDYEMITTNDTEHLIEKLALEGIRGIERDISGYYAVAAYDDKKQLHIIRDSIAPLFVAFVDSIQSYIFSTTKENILELAKKMVWTHSLIAQMNDNLHLIFGENNNVLHEASIRPRGFSERETRHARLSLGRDMDANNPQYTDDEMAFLAEVTNNLDETYTIYDYSERRIALDEFQQLSDDEKLYCTVIRSDGTQVDSTDYYSEKYARMGMY